MITQIPEHFFEVRYVGERYPGNAAGLEEGANCQHFCYEVLRYFGFEIGSLRSSDLWEDTKYTEWAEEIKPFDLILFNKGPRARGAHVGICIGEDKILHLSKLQGKPVIWNFNQFQNLNEYSHFIGIKRPKIRQTKSSKNVTRFLAVLVTILFPALSLAAQFDCLDLNIKPVLNITYANNITEDFILRDLLPETEAPKIYWKTDYGNFGPCPITYPNVVTSQPNKTDWSRKRIIEVAKKYNGLPYEHFHIPAMGGLDCSNFTSWIYNYGFGIRFSSNLKRQPFEAGRRLTITESLAPGDLIFLYNHEHNEIVHVAVYVNEKNIIDSTGFEVGLRPFAGRYKTDFAWARRILE